jgi:hypothetical protein
MGRPEPAFERIGRRALAIVAVAAVLIAGLVGAAGARADDYVALGDSYAAGPFIPDPLPPFGCLKSDHNYPHLAAPKLGLPLRDPSCSGATTDDMTAPQDVSPDGPNPPQFDSLDPATRIVSLSIGGNDIGFADIAASCVTVNPFGHPCRDRYDSNGDDQIHDRIVAAAPKVAAVLRGIRARAPTARIYVLNYPAIFPAHGDGCWPQVPIAFDDVPYLRAKERELNAMLAKRAAAADATLVDWYSASLGHDSCESASVRWVEPLVPSDLAAPIHPNKRGMKGAAHALAAAAG